MSETKLADQAARGEDAKRILEHPLVNEAFESIRQTCIDAWENSRGEDTEVRQNAYLMQRLLRNLREQFTLQIANGKHAEKELLELSKPRTKIRRLSNHG